MDFPEVVRRRRMVRRFDADQPVDPAVVRRVLDHAHRAPTAGSSQGRAYLLLDTPADVDRFWATTSPDPGASNRWLDGMRTAPVLAVVLADPTAYAARYAEPDKVRAGLADVPTEAWPVPWWHVDAGMAAHAALLTAVDEGLGACFFGVPGARWAAFREAFGLPDAWLPVGALALGHRLPGDTGSPGSAASSAHRRPPLDDVVHRARFGG